MDFKLTQEYHRKPLSSGFYVDIELMGGDGAIYEKICIGRFNEKDFDILRDLVGTLEKIAEVPSGYTERYDSIEGFQTWFCELGGVDKKDFRYKFFKDQFMIFNYASEPCYGWARDSAEFNYQMVAYNVFYVSEYGGQYKVNVEK